MDGDRHIVGKTAVRGKALTGVGHLVGLTPSFGPIFWTIACAIRPQGSQMI